MSVRAPRFEGEALPVSSGRLTRVGPAARDLRPGRLIWQGKACNGSKQGKIP